MNVREILDTADADDALLKEELSKHTCLDAITESYDEVKARADAQDEREKEEEFLRNVELETKRMDAKRKKAMAKTQKKNEPFDEDAFNKAFIAQSRFLKDREEIHTK